MSELRFHIKAYSIERLCLLENNDSQFHKLSLQAHHQNRIAVG